MESRLRFIEPVLCRPPNHYEAAWRVLEDFTRACAAAKISSPALSDALLEFTVFRALAIGGSQGAERLIQQMEELIQEWIGVAKPGRVPSNEPCTAAFLDFIMFREIAMGGLEGGELLIRKARRLIEDWKTGRVRHLKPDLRNRATELVEEKLAWFIRGGVEVVNIPRLIFDEEDDG